jgi:hypothetical protein
MDMNHFLSLGFISLFLLISLTGICIADEAPGYLVYIQGGETSIAKGSDGAYMITVKDIVPYFYITDGEQSRLLPVELLNRLTYPRNAALILSGADNETTVMVQVENMSQSDENRVLTLQAGPLEYYEGERLTSFYDKSQEINGFIDGQFARLGVYVEGVRLPLSNQELEMLNFRQVMEPRK